MKLFAFALLIASLIQTSFLPIDLCLVLLICRSYAVHNPNNYFLALLAGLFLGILTSTNIGFWPIFFVITVLVIHLIRLLPITGRFLTVVPVAFLILLAGEMVANVFLRVPLNYWYPAIGSLIALPIYIAIKEWEERFVAKPGIKLKL